MKPLIITREFLEEVEELLYGTGNIYVDFRSPWMNDAPFRLVHKNDDSFIIQMKDLSCHLFGIQHGFSCDIYYDRPVTLAVREVKIEQVFYE